MRPSTSGRSPKGDVNRLFDPAFRAEWCNGDAAWNIDVLHLIGHPVTAAEWHWLEELRDADDFPTSPEAATSYYRREHGEFN